MRGHRLHSNKDRIIRDYSLRMNMTLILLVGGLNLVGQRIFIWPGYSKDYLIVIYDILKK